MAGALGRAGHDGGNAADDAARRRSVDVVGGVRIRSARQPGEPKEVPRARTKGTPTFSRSAITSTSASATCSSTTASDRHAPYELQRGFVDHLRAAGSSKARSVRSNFTPFIIPVGGPLRRPGRGRVLLAGDAGGFVNGFTAEGIYYAMVSGDLARERDRRDGRRRRSTAAVSRYRRACDREIGAELRDSVLIQRYLFADRRRIARVIAGASREHRP